MSVFPRERPHSFVDRFAISRRCSLAVMGILLALNGIGCRSLDTISASSGTQAANPETRSSRSIFSRSTSFLAKKTSRADKPSASSETTKADQESDGKDSLSSDHAAPKRTSNALVTRRKQTVTDSETQPISFTSADLDDDEENVESAGFQDERVSDQKRRDTDDDVPKELDPESFVSGDLSLSIPKEIPGATAPRHRLPPRADDKDTAGVARKMKVIDLLFPERGEPLKIGPPTDRVMTLEELEEIALANNPTIAQAMANITIAQGAAVQAGLYPNPTAGYEADTVGSTGTRNYQGLTIQQPIKTAGKLSLAQAVANMDVMNAQLACERTKMDVLRAVRAGYYNVLIAEQGMKFTGALERLTRQVYEGMKERLKGGEEAVYALDQYNSLVIQAKTALVQSQNRFRSAWQQLAVSTGILDLPQAALAGRVDMPVQNLNYDAVLQRMLTVHPDLYAARNLQSKAQTQLKYARAQVLPDITLLAAFQNDFTQPGFQRTSYNLDATIPLPLFDRNQGNIRSAQGNLQFMTVQGSVKSMELTTLLADAFERFQTGRYQSLRYRREILPDLVRAYQGIYDAHLSDNPDVQFGDIILAQQNLANGVSVYVTFLTMQWVALADIANLIQLRDFGELLDSQSSLVENPGDVVPPPISQEGGRK